MIALRKQKYSTKTNKQIFDFINNFPKFDPFFIWGGDKNI